MKKIIVLLVGSMLYSSAFGFEVLSSNISVVENNDMWTTRHIATIQGDYNEFVDRASDITQYPTLGVPYWKNSKIVSGNRNNRVLWVHTYIWPRNSYFYLKSNTNRGEGVTSGSFRLVPKSGPHPNEHNAEHLSGNYSVKLINGNGKNSIFRLNSTTRFKLKDGSWIPNGLLRRGLHNYSAGTLKALTSK